MDSSGSIGVPPLTIQASRSGIPSVESNLLPTAQHESPNVATPLSERQAAMAELRTRASFIRLGRADPHSSLASSTLAPHSPPTMLPPRSPMWSCVDLAALRNKSQGHVVVSEDVSDHGLGRRAPVVRAAKSLAKLKPAGVMPGDLVSSLGSPSTPSVARAGSPTTVTTAATAHAAADAPAASALIRRLAGMDPDEALEMIRSNIVGDHLLLTTPFGEKALVYADYTASGRALRVFESFIQEAVLPMYANTHTEASATGLQTQTFREEARALVARSVNAAGCPGGGAHVIFCGSGSTAAIHKAVGMLGLEPRRHGATASGGGRRGLPAVFISPYEHHSNDLPWREHLVELHQIPEDARGMADIADLERRLRALKDRPLRICSFSAASNVTGVQTDVLRLSAVCRAQGALLFVDFAGGGPYMEIDMSLLDAAFISPHKMVGGPATPGVLVCSRRTFDPRNLAELWKHTTAPKATPEGMEVPHHPGGGTVAYVSPWDAKYTKDVVAREEAGTPAIVDSIRCGLCFLLKDRVTTEWIHRAESRAFANALAKWEGAPIVILGPAADVPRVSIFSFLISVPGNRYLHFNFVVSVLNDLYGVQARGGCACAGPYGHRLFGFDEHTAEHFWGLVQQYGEGVKLGWARINLNYFVAEDPEQNYILAAVRQIAEKGWALLPLYDFNLATGQWTRKDWEAPVASLLAPVAVRAVAPGDVAGVLAAQLRRAAGVLDDAVARLRAAGGGGAGYSSPDSEALRPGERWWAEPPDFRAGAENPAWPPIVPRGTWLHSDDDLPPGVAPCLRPAAGGGRTSYDAGPLGDDGAMDAGGARARAAPSPPLYGGVPPTSPASPAPPVPPAAGAPLQCGAPPFGADGGARSRGCGAKVCCFGGHACAVM